MAQYSSKNTGKPQPQAPIDGAGFGADGEQKKKRKFPKGLLVGAFAAAALGGGIMFANLSREDDVPRTLNNQDFNNAAIISEESLFFGTNSGEYKEYQWFVSEGRVASGASYIAISESLNKIYEVSPHTIQGVAGVKYTDVTDQVQATDYNGRVVVSDHHHRQFSKVLRQFDDLNADFDPEIGIVKLTDNAENTFSYHIYQNEAGYGDVKIISDAYLAAHGDVIDRAAAQMASMGQAALLWDNGINWPAFMSKTNSRCAQEARCSLS